ncbi:MAG: aminotransferase class I/II-fold pyridoxal phosphate-dependent enzyme [Bacteroidota bacterium]
MIISPAARLADVKEYYFARKLREIRSRMAAGESIINLGIGNPDMMPSEDTIKELVNRAVEPGNHGYQPYKGIPQLRSAYAAWYFDTYGVKLDPDQEILPLMGSKEGIMHISMAFLNPGDKVLVPNPGYPTYTSISRLVGAEIVYYELNEENNWLPDLAALADQDLSQVKLMWINYPHMPTGTNASPEVLTQLVEFAQEHQILLCHDNPYSLVLNPEPRSIFSIPGSKEVAVELNSLSKSHNMAGWRMGMVAGTLEYVATILKVKSNMDSGMFMPMQAAAAKALGNSYQWHAERNEVYAYRRQLAERMLKVLGCEFRSDQVGMFVWAKVPNQIESGAWFSDWVLDQSSVFIAPGFIFGSQGERYVRISLCAPTAQMEQALERLNSLVVKG